MGSKLHVNDALIPVKRQGATGYQLQVSAVVSPLWKSGAPLYYPHQMQRLRVCVANGSIMLSNDGSAF